MTKICNTCNKELDISNFHFKKDRNKYSNKCKTCFNAEGRDRYYTDIEKNKQRAIIYRKHNKDKMLKYQNEYFKKNKNIIREKAKTYYISHKEEALCRSKKWHDSNKEKVKEVNRRCKQKYKERNKEQQRLYRLNNFDSSGKPKSQKWRLSKKAYMWTESVYKRDNYTCQHCNKSKCRLNAHHIKPASKYKKLRYELSNGICLCDECHNKLHYGVAGV